MSMALATHHGPPTPPIRDPYSLRQGSLRSHQGTSLQYQQEYLDDTSYLHSGTSSAYNSPRPGQALMDESGATFTHLGESDHGVYRQYDNQANSTFVPYRDSTYPNPMQHQTYPNPTIHGRLSTPELSDPLGRNLRQARRLMPNSFPRTPSPPRRRKQAKKDNMKKSKLEKPLSELTKHLDRIPIKDTETWVNRSTEERQKEVGSDGFIKRPSNSFILYRSAYADRCREYEKSNNHQDISSMAGASWAIELPEVRKQYEDWAKTERENHQIAFPDYKFQPQTQEAKVRKRKGKMDDDSLDDSDLEDPTYRGGRGATPGSSRSDRAKKMRRNYRESSYTPSLGSDGEWGSPEPYPAPIHSTSYYHHANPGKPMPSALTGIGPPGGYYQATCHPNVRFSAIGHVEDVMYQQHEAPTSMYGAQPPVGLPGVSHEELMGETDLDNEQLMFTGVTLDPDLLAYDNGGSVQAEGHGGLAAGGFQTNEYLAEEHVDFGGDGNPGDKWDPFEDDH